MYAIVRTPHRLAFALATVLLLTALFMFMWGRVEAASSTIGVQSARVVLGQTAALPVVLSDAPNGLAGMDIVVNLSNPNVASIVAGELPAFGLTSVEIISPSEVRFRAVDVAGIVEAGALDAGLATLTVQGDKNGSTDVLINIIRLDDEAGSPIGPAVLIGTISVKKSFGGKGGGGDKGGSGDKGGKGKGPKK